MHYFQIYFGKILDQNKFEKQCNSLAFIIRIYKKNIWPYHSSGGTSEARPPSQALPCGIYVGIFVFSPYLISFLSVPFDQTSKLIHSFLTMLQSEQCTVSLNNALETANIEHGNEVWNCKLHNLFNIKIEYAFIQL